MSKANITSLVNLDGVMQASLSQWHGSGGARSDHDPNLQPRRHHQHPAEQRATQVQIVRARREGAKQVNGTLAVVAVLVLASGACSGSGGQGSPGDREDAGALFLVFPDASASCRDSQGAPATATGDAGDPLCLASEATVSFANDVAPVLARCGGDVCHAPWQYKTLVGQHSVSCCDHRWLVEPGRPSTSHVVQALRGVNACVPQMPLDEGQLADPQIAAVVAWVCQGALDN
jgi:hypothetical protein